VLSKPMPTLNRTRYAATARMSRLRQCPSRLRKRQADWNRQRCLRDRLATSARLAARLARIGAA